VEARWGRSRRTAKRGRAIGGCASSNSLVSEPRGEAAGGVEEEVGRVTAGELSDILISSRMWDCGESPRTRESSEVEDELDIIVGESSMTKAKGLLKD